MPKEQRFFIPLFVAVAAFAIVAFTPQIFNDSDTYWHIAAGERMLSEHAILFRDPFSYTFAGKSWSAHEWLSEIVMALAYRTGGWSALAILFAAAFAVAAAQLAHYLSRWFAPLVALTVSILALACMSGSLLARPHILALPLLIAWTIGVLDARTERRAPSPWLLAVMMLWANLHGGFALGFLLLLYCALEAWLEDGDRLKTLKTWGFFALGAVIAALLTPHFIDGLLFPFRLLAMHQLAGIGEWQPTNFATLQPLEIVILAALYFFLTRGTKLPAGRLLLSLLLMHMAFQHVRHQLVFAAVVPLLLAQPLAGMKQEHATQTGIAKHYGLIAASLALVVLISIARLECPVSRSDSATAPATALSQVPGSVQATPVLNDYQFGGYLIFENVPVFIDSRAELYGDALLGTYSRIIAPDAATLTATLEKYRIGWTIFSPGSPAVTVLDLLPGWRRLYTDKFAVVHVRKSDH